MVTISYCEVYYITFTQIPLLRTGQLHPHPGLQFNVQIFIIPLSCYSVHATGNHLYDGALSVASHSAHIKPDGIGDRGRTPSGGSRPVKMPLYRPSPACQYLTVTGLGGSGSPRVVPLDLEQCPSNCSVEESGSRSFPLPW